jgi:hypothetical protein
MTEGKAASTSSALTARSKSWPAVVRLGERIVAELGLEESTDTLSRWMAHHIAEAITRAEKGRRKDKDAAADLILRLWEHRTSWPNGWPPEQAETFRRGLRDDRYEPRSASADDKNPWLARIGELSELHREEYEVWRRLAFAEASFEEELARWSEEDLEQKEKLLLTSLLADQKEAVSNFAERAGEANTPRDRIEVAKEELRAVGRKRGALFRKVASEVRDRSEPK